MLLHVFLLDDIDALAPDAVARVVYLVDWNPLGTHWGRGYRAGNRELMRRFAPNVPAPNGFIRQQTLGDYENTN